MADSFGPRCGCHTYIYYYLDTILLILLSVKATSTSHSTRLPVERWLLSGEIGPSGRWVF